MHHNGNTLASGPFQRGHLYSDPESPRSSLYRDGHPSPQSQDINNTAYISPFIGHQDPSQSPLAPDNTDRDLLRSYNNTPLHSPTPASNSSLSTRLETAIAVPFSRLNLTKHLPRLIRNPFTSRNLDTSHRSPIRQDEIDDFSTGWNRALAVHDTEGLSAYDRDRDTHIHSGDMPEPAEMDVGLAGAVRRAASNIAGSGNGRTVDDDARREGIRQQNIDEETPTTAWGTNTAEQIRAQQLVELRKGKAASFAAGPSTHSPTNPNPIGSNHGAHLDGAGRSHEEGEESLREQVMEAFERATRGSVVIPAVVDNRRSIDSPVTEPETPVRYQLFDEEMSGTAIRREWEREAYNKI